MSDPFSDPDARPWTPSGEPIVPSQSSSGFGDPDAPPPPPAFGQPPGVDGWSQPPSAPPAQWGAPAGDQAQWGPPPQAGPPGGQPWGQPGPQQWGQAPYGQPPQKSSSTKIVIIVVAVLFVLIALPIVGALILFSVGSTTVGEVIEQGVEEFDVEAGVPDGPRLLETSGAVSQGGDQSFSFTVPDRTTVQIDVIGRSGFDPVTVLRDAAGLELAEDDDGGQGRDSRITTELSSGTYTVEVRGFASASGEFRIVVTDR